MTAYPDYPETSRPERSILLSPLILGLAALIVAVVGVGAYFYVTGGEKSKLQDGACLDDLSGNTPNIAKCGSPGAIYKILVIFHDTVDSGLCSSVTGADIPTVIDTEGRKDVLCITKVA
ncbi:MAG: hypothetical protein HOV68_26270 [Streptomycetaceae bacterium]|nr:hypothetical protein [Streptomycetaceae bacterium]